MCAERNQAVRAPNLSRATPDGPLPYYPSDLSLGSLVSGAIAE